MRCRWLVFVLSSLAMAESLPGDRKISSEATVGLLSFAENGKTLAAQCGDGKIRLWDVPSGTLRRTHGNSPVNQPSAFLRGVGSLATVSSDGGVQVWDATTATMVRELPVVTPKAGRVALSNVNSLVATSHMPDRQTSVNQIRLRDGSGKEVFAAPAGIGGISVLGLSPDGATLVAGSYDADLRAWSVRNGELIRVIDALPVSMFAMSFSPDGKVLATAGADRTIYLWDTKSWNLQRKITGQPDMISALEFSPDGKRLITGGFSELTMANPVTLIVWDVATGKQLRVMPAPRRVAAVAFSPDGKYIASSYGDKSLDIWQAPE